MALSVKLESFAAIEETWRQLLPICATNTIFCTPLWQKVWWGQFSEGRKLQLLAIDGDAQSLGIAPLMGQGETLSFIGSVDVCDYLDFVVVRGQEAAFYQGFLEYFDSSRWRMLELHCLPANSPTLTYLPGLAALRGYSVDSSVEDVCPRVDLPSTWEEYIAALGKKDRHELRRKLRRLLGGRQADCYMIQKLAQTSDLEDFFRLHRQSSEDKAKFMTPQMERFFESMAYALTEEGFLRLFFLEVDGVRVSSTLCFDYGDELSLYNSGFDTTYAALSVGFLLKAFCVKKAIVLGKKRFDFLRGAEPYKYNLGAKDLPVYRCTIGKR